MGGPLEDGPVGRSGPPWAGAWVRDHAGISVTDAGLLPGLGLTDLFGLALRANPKRPQLLVSTVLGKHVPTDPRVVRAAGLLLGCRVAHALGRLAGSGGPDRALPARLAAAVSDPAAVPALADGVAAECGRVPPTGPDGGGLVVAYAETATALGHLVARALRLPVIHSTRRRVTGHDPALGFDEAHSHAVEHLLLPADPGLLAEPGPCVLVDDELSTGRTALATVRELVALQPDRRSYLVAALVDVRGPEDRAAMAAVAAELGVSIDVVSLGAGTVTVPADAGERAAGVPAAAVVPAAPRPTHRVPARWTWPSGVREGGRHGLTPADDAALEEAAAAVAHDLAPDLGASVLVLGTEELMHAPLAIAAALVHSTPPPGGREVRFSTTTRSPVRVLDEEGYAVRSGVAFRAHDRDADDGIRFAYNLDRDEPGARWSDLVVVVDSPALTERFRVGALPALAAHADRVHVVAVPVVTGRPRELHGNPDDLARGFGSYAPEEVTWLLTDLSDVALEADIATREAAIQAGEAHYAESLPVEYRPEPAYRRLFHEQLDEVADRVAAAVGTVAELARRTRGRDDLVLVSLARAGTPIGILMRRWARHRHGLDWPHYTISIVRDRGIDLVAMRHLADRLDPGRVLFVDGWTGKGAIMREFADAVAGANADLELGDPGCFSDDLAVLADPGECVELFGTRDDFLIPSACLNSTVSGLVSRTVLNDRLIGAGDFHGAKFYAELAEEDVSGLYLDTVSARFDHVAAAAVEEAERLLDTDRTPTWVGWLAAEKIRADYGLPHINLVKPGVGETTRVLLRRVPWQVVVNPDRAADLRHVELLAADRGVPVVPVPGLPYSCIGLIRPTEQDSS